MQISGVLPLRKERVRFINYKYKNSLGKYLAEFTVMKAWFFKAIGAKLLLCNKDHNLFIRERIDGQKPI